MVNMDCTSFILVTLLNSGGTFESVTKLQKIAFLSTHEGRLEPFTSFIWHRYGPYSKELDETVDVLVKEGSMIEESIDRMSYSGNEYTIKRLSLTPRGMKLAKAKVCKINSDNKEALLETIDKYGSEPLSNILEYVYKAYSPKDL